MARPLPLLLAISAGFAMAMSCYAERQPPPTFRYSCDGDSDCNADERCVRGLCQVPCTQLTFDDVCLGDNHLTCFNGVCSTGCDTLESDPCPESQSCIDIGLTVTGGGFIDGGSQTKLGICGTMCTEDSCPGSEMCIQGFCVVPCVGDDECPSGLVCTTGLCLPGAEEDESGDDDAATESSMDGTTDAGATTSAEVTGGAT